LVMRGDADAPPVEPRERDLHSHASFSGPGRDTCRTTRG
jgi:hypothetical protein